MSSNIDYLIPELQLEIGDLDGTSYSSDTYTRALLSGVKYLSKRWFGKYYVDADNNVQRSTEVSFNVDAPPVVEYNDEYAIVLAGALILRKVALTSSADSFSNWSTPDLSVSTGSKERVLSKLYSDAAANLEAWFKGRLGRSQKRFMVTRSGTYPLYTKSEINLSAHGTDTSTE